MGSSFHVEIAPKEPSGGLSVKAALPHPQGTAPSPHRIYTTSWDSTRIVRGSTLSPYDFIIRIHHLFIELALPLLLRAHASSGTYAKKGGFAQNLISKLATKGAAVRWADHEIEQMLEKCGSAGVFARDPSVILNRLRIIRNNVIHADPSVEETGGVERWGGIYLRYFEGLLEELDLVRIG